MKVLCINDNGWRIRKKFWLYKWFTTKGVHGPKYMEECTVTDELENEFGPAYRLSEYGNNKYPQKAFVQLYDIDETALVNTKEECV